MAWQRFRLVVICERMAGPPLLVIMVLYVAIPFAQAGDSKWSAKLSQAEQLYDNRQFTEAIAAAEESLHAAEKQFGREVPELTGILSFLSTLYSAKAAFDEKPNLNRQAIIYTRREAAILRKQTTPSAKQQLVASLSGLGHACQMVRDLKCAVKSYEEAIATAEPLEANPDDSPVDALRILARLKGERKELVSAEKLMHRYLAIRERVQMRPQRHLEIDYEFAAQDFANWQNDTEAERLYGLAIREAKAHDQSDREPNVAYLLGRAASFLTSLTRYDQARSMLDEALVILRTAGEVHGSAQIYRDKATICKLLGDRAGAMALLDQANQALKASAGIVIEPYTYEQLPSTPRLARHGI